MNFNNCSKYSKCFALVTEVRHQLSLPIPFANSDLETQHINNLRDKVSVIQQREADKSG